MNETLKKVLNGVKSVAPMLVEAVVGERAGDAMEGLLRAVTGDPPGTTAEAMAAKIDADPALMIRLQEIAKEREVELAKIESSNFAVEVDQLKSVNETMRVELANSATEKWYQKGWRPFCGFVVGAGSFVAVIFVCWLFWKAIELKDMTAIPMVPTLAMAIASILAVPGAAVGITAWHRGMEKRSGLPEK